MKRNTLLTAGCLHVLISTSSQFVFCFVPHSAVTSSRLSLTATFATNARHDTGIAPFTGALDTIPSLASLPLIPYIDAKTGDITKSGGDEESQHPSVFAIYDENKDVQYVGTTDHLDHMLKVMLARRPDKTHYYKSYNIVKPSRSYVDLALDFWLAEVDGVPPGNAGGEEEDLWEKPLDVKPMFTEQDYQDIEELEKTGHMTRDMAMKVVTWKFEDSKMSILRDRGFTADLHFDLSLKGEGQLDLKADDRNLMP